MTKEEVNQIIKDAMVRNLQKETKIPEDIGRTYRNWLYGKIQQATDMLKQQQSSARQGMSQGQEQSEQPAEQPAEEESA